MSEKDSRKVSHSGSDLVGTDSKVMPRYTVVHIPHDGRAFPEELMPAVCIPRDTFMLYHETMRDKCIGIVVPAALQESGSIVRFEVSRLLCDPERFIGPDEIMERCGMGFCYERAYDGERIKIVTEELKTMTKKYYDEHHALLDRICREHDRILFFDLHSFHDVIVPRGQYPEDGTPDVCIGTDERFTPPELFQYVFGRFREAGFRVGVNTPYSGTLIPNAVMNGKCCCDLIGIMIELHRRTYLDEENNPDPAKTERIWQIFSSIAADCVGL